MKIKSKLLIIIYVFIVFNFNATALENKIILRVNNEIITSIDIFNEIKYLTTLNPGINKLKEIEDWLGKNGLTILFTLGEAYGDETVYLGSDQKIYIGTEKLPKKAWLKKCLLSHSSELLQKAVKERWTRHEIFRELKKLSEMV